MAAADTKTRAETLLLGVASAVLIALLLGGWASKESVAAHAADITAVRAERARGNDSVLFRLDELRRIVCAQKKVDACK